ncbi:hypothetical protein [Segniliparus rugosus]|uniref:Uncharacterized protein n=1 Tax=Segniliparus rugosus (strain ATCC BAA-974 / DSM 45345 / CCUG 50838 / CIP 108380 / JCM 13579 / CDC 945) TaxID=679197 RepID=E5XNI8_SEGRC|nr:hypothetical protein [Segniliparus rugosus]EFV14100.1 hypothetical protein HMPREF9336_01017 [Segniliparus rugosus ATCC BAA-974]
MLALIGFLLVVWLVLTIVGLFVKTLAWLVYVGALLFVATAVIGWLKRKTSSSSS